MFHDFFDNLILENCDIGYFEYPTSLWYCKTLSLASNIPLIGNKIQYKFNTNIDTLTDLLKTEYDINKSKYKNIHFIGHSLGGIIIKNFLVNYYEDNSKKPFFITLSTPHNGSPYAEKFSFFSNPQISELKYKSEILIRLSDSFKKKKEQFNRKYYVAINDQIVKEKDAFQTDDVKNKVNVHGNHIMISKPTLDVEFKTLLDHINKTIIEFLNLKDDLNKIMILDQYKLNIRDILFEGYQKKSYNYYLEREIDKKVSKLLETKNVWLFGNSGVGKTNIAQYYFHNKDCFFHSTYFTTIEDNVNNYLNILYIELLDRINGDIKVGEKHNVKQKLKVILCDLSKQYDNIVIHLDELSDLGPVNTKEFLISFLDILTNSIMGCGLTNISLIISTRFNPIKYLDSFDDISHKTKIETLFSFIEVELWNVKELNSLYDILFKALHIEIEDIENKIGNTINYPRELKNCLQKKLSQ